MSTQPNSRGLRDQCKWSLYTGRGVLVATTWADTGREAAERFHEFGLRGERIVCYGKERSVSGMGG